MEIDGIMDRITQLKENKGWTESELARKAGLTQSTISSLFKRNNLPTIPTLDALCKAFDITLAQFFADYSSYEYLDESQKNLLKQWDMLNNAQKKSLLDLMSKM